MSISLSVLIIHIAHLRAICGTQLIDRKRAKDLMLGLDETMDHLAVANSVHCMMVNEGEWSCTDKGS